MFRIMWAFLKKSYQQESSYKLSFIMTFFGIFFSVVTYFFLAKLVPGEALAEYGGNYFSFVLVGVAFTSFLGLCLNGFTGFIRSSQVSGTMESILVTPIKMRYVLFGSLLWSFALVFMQAILYIIFGLFFFRLELNANILSAAVVFILSILVFGAIGILGAGMIMIFKRGDPLTWAFTSFSGILGGAMFPITILPSWLQKASYLVPLSYSLRAFRYAVLNGAPLYIIAFDVIFLLVFAAVLFPISLWLFRFAVKKAKKDGSLMKF